MAAPMRNLQRCLLQSYFCSGAVLDRSILPRRIVKSNAFSTESIVNNMGDRATWNKFYKRKQESNFNWFLCFEDVYEKLEKYFPQQDQWVEKRTFNILDIGCGTSLFSIEFLNAVAVNSSLWCVDFSQVAINQLRNSMTPDRLVSAGDPVTKNVRFVVADTCTLPFRSEVIDIAFDKGTLDAVLRADSTHMKATACIHEAIRVLSPSGVLLHFSDEDPDIRLHFLQQIANKYMSENKNTTLSVGYQSATDTCDPIEYFMYTVSKSIS